MFKLFQKRNRQQSTTTKSKYDFVEQYTLVDPKNVLIDYSAFNMCKKIPVACEHIESTTSTFKNCVHLPNNKPFSDFLYQLTLCDKKQIKNPIFRTISIVNMAPGKQLFILPDIKNIRSPICVVNFDSGNTDDWVLYVTPEINRAIVDQVKMFTRYESR